MNIEKELHKIIFKVVDKEEFELSLNDDLENVLGYTSIDYIQLIVDLEDYFQIEFDFVDIDLQYYRTYGVLLEFVKSKLKTEEDLMRD